MARSGTGIPFLALTAGLLFVLVMASCSSQAEPGAAPPPPEVSVATVLSKSVSSGTNSPAASAAVETVELRPRVSGYVERVAFKEGQEVNKGDLLFVIDQRRYRAALDSAQAELERAAAKRAWRRPRTRARRRWSTPRRSRARSSRRARPPPRRATPRVRAAEAAVATAQLDLQFTQVRAPIDGRAGRALVTEGNLAQADATLLTTVVSQDPVYVYFESDEQSFLRYNELARKGERAEPKQSGAASAWPTRTAIRMKARSTSSTTRSIRAPAPSAPAPCCAIRTACSRRACSRACSCEGSGEFKAMLIDDKAVLTDQDRKYVYVLGPKNAAMRKDIVLGRMVDGLRVVELGPCADRTR